MSLVERVRTLCDRKNTTLVGLERELGFGRGTIRNWDKNSPSVDKVQKVADYFNVSVDYLLYGHDRIKRSSNQAIDTVAAHLEDKDITPRKLRLLEKYIDALFEDSE